VAPPPTARAGEPEKSPPEAQASPRPAPASEAKTRSAKDEGKARKARPAPSSRTKRQGADGRVHDVVVVGGGPSGAACAYWLADAGWDVLLLEKKHFPREKTCGDGLTPRAVRQLTDMGLAGALSGAHRYSGLRACAYGRTVELPWPDHPSFPPIGYVITRHDLDQAVAERAAKAGAELRQGAEAIAPIVEGSREAAASTEMLPSCVGLLVKDHDTGKSRPIRGRYVVVADGSNSRIGRALGASRDKVRPLGMALRGYFRSPRHDEDFIESHLDIRDESGTVLPGYGWIFPIGDGRVNVGVGLLTVEGRWRGVNTSHLMERFVRSSQSSWGISPETALGAPTGGKLPMGLAVAPRVGPNAVVIGDAAGVVNPFNGEGIAYGYETGRMAASCIGRALSGEGPDALSDYERQLQEAYGLYYQVARDFVKLVSNPSRMQLCVRTGMQSRNAMEWLLRIMANLLRPDEIGAAEVAYRGLSTVARLGPRD
jgi:menaquinone-9 beta-reductase